MLASPGSSTISPASDAKIICITFTSHPSPSCHTTFFHGYLRQTEGGGGGADEKELQQGLFFCLFFSLWPCEGETRCFGGELKFQNGAYRLYFSPLMRVPSSPHLPSPTPPFYLNHTSNNEWGEDRARGSTLVRFCCFEKIENKKKKNRCIADLHRWVRNILSNLHYVVWWYESPSTQSAASLFKIGIMSHLPRWQMTRIKILLNLFLVFICDVELFFF